jgi:hypothetical protein
MGIAALLALSIDSTTVRGEAQKIEAALRQKFQAYVLRATDCGAAGDGQTDDTANLNRCIQTLPAYATLDGEGRSYRVSALQLKSGMRFRNFRLIKAAGAANMTSPVTLDGRTEAKADVLIENVEVEGRRTLETELVTPSAEDGGRHCFRIVGRISNVVLANVSGENCATDGLQLGGHHATLSDEPEGLAVQNVVVRRAKFNGNRRVGIAFEGVHNAYFLDIEAQANGRTIAPGADRTAGAHCAHVDGYCFGTGIWTENDHDAAGGAFHDVFFVNANVTRNQTRALYAYSNSGPNVHLFRTKSGLNVLDSRLDSGVFPIAGNPMAIQFASSSPDGAGAVYSDIVIERSTIEGTIGARSIDGLTLGECRMAQTLLGYIEYFDNVTVRATPGEFQSSLWLRPDGTPGAKVVYQ